jgi:hypothetical protein
MILNDVVAQNMAEHPDNISALENMLVVKMRINASPPPDSRRLRVSVAEPRTMATSANYERAVDNAVPPHLCFTSCP